MFRLVFSGRVFLQQGGYTWRYKNDFCRNQTKDDLECYLLPFSKCTIQEHHTESQQVRDEVSKWLQSCLVGDNLTHWCILHVGNRTVTINRIPVAVLNYPNGPLTLSGPAANDPVVMVTDRMILNHHLREYDSCCVLRIHPFQLLLILFSFLTFSVVILFYLLHLNSDIIPHSLLNIITCAKLSPGSEYLWWRSISLTYLVRPNKNLLALLESHRDTVVKNAQGTAAIINTLNQSFTPFHSLCFSYSQATVCPPTSVTVTRIVRWSCSLSPHTPTYHLFCSTS